MISTMQARFGEDRYPIGRLILERTKTLGLSRTDLVQRFGYVSLNSGQRALTELLMTGTPTPIIAAKLAEALEVEQDLLDAVLAATARQRHDEARSRILEQERAYRAAFRPHLQIQTEHAIPSPIFIAALIGTARLRLIALPDDTFSAEHETRDRIVKSVIVEHYRDHAGYVPAFGTIIGYVLVLLHGYERVDFGLPFDVTGDPAGAMCEVRRLPEATLGVKRGDTRLTGLFRNTEIRTLPSGGTP